MKRLIGVSLLSVLGLSVAGCSSTGPNAANSDANQVALHDEAKAALEQMKATDAGVQTMLDKAYAYAIFPNVGQGGLVVGGAPGKGTVYQNGHIVGYATLEQASVGLQAGGQTYSELIIFETPEALNRFENGNFSFGADATASILKAGTAGQTSFQHGIAIYVLPKGGLMAGVSLDGQKFKFSTTSWDNNGQHT